MGPALSKPSCSFRHWNLNSCFVITFKGSSHYPGIINYDIIFLNVFFYPLTFIGTLWRPILWEKSIIIIFRFGCINKIFVDCKVSFPVGVLQGQGWTQRGVVIPLPLDSRAEVELWSTLPSCISSSNKLEEIIQRKFKLFGKNPCPI